MKCSVCRAEIAEGGRFCTQCGAAVSVRCAGCGLTNPPESRFCGGCGAGLGASGGNGAARSATAAIAQSGRERRHLTVLFSDIVGSTELAKALDPEDLNDITRGYYEACAASIGQFDGIIANFMGDGVMGLFGYPVAHEDDAERAIHAALSIMGAQQKAAGNGMRVKLRIGIASGLVVVGEDGEGPLTKEKTVVGETPNLAAHLQAAAEPNTVLIADATRRLVGDVFVLKDAPLASARHAMPAWQVVREKPRRSRFEARVSVWTEFVGRDQEVHLLSDRWRQAKLGEGQAVLLSGEAGIGKSRIVEAFRQTIAQEDHSLRYCQCSPFHVDSALYPIITEIERAAGLGLDDSGAARLERIERLLACSADRLQELIPLFAALLSIPTEGRYPEVDPDPQRRKERTLQAIVDQTAILSRAAPLLLIVEDAHWIDSTTLDLLTRILLQLSDMRLLLIVTCRPEFSHPWTGHPSITALRLDRLGRRHCQQMISSVAGKALPPDVAEQIFAKTDGVPLFVEELTKTVIESGLLSEQGDAWVLNRPLPPLAIPATLQDSLTARLDRLSSVKDVAQIGATIGREFSYDLIAAVSRLPDEILRQALAGLCEAQLLFARGTPPNASYIFKHALVQDAAYETVLKSRRQQLHARIAGVLENEFAEIAATQPELVAHHYTQAGLTRTAVIWWHKAGELAIRRSANPEAVRNLRRAIELLQLGPKDRASEETELAIRIKLSGPLIATRGYVTSELAENYERGWELCSRLGEDKSAFPVMYGQWVIPYVRGDMATALAKSETFLKRAEQQDDPALLLMGHRIYGSSLVWSGNTLPGSRHLQQALSIYRPDEHDSLAYVFSQHPRTAALAHLCLALQHLGHLDRAMASGWEAISQAKRIEHFNSIAYSLCFVSLLIMLRRDVETLRGTAGELLELAERHKASYWALWARPMLGWVKAQDGDIDRGVEEMHQSTEELKLQSANLWVPQTMLLEAEILGEAKQYGHAYRLLDEAQALIEPLDQRFYEAELHRVRGMIMLADGRQTQGEASLDRAIAVAALQNSRFLKLRACACKARLWLRRGRRAQARDFLMPIYQSFSEGLDTVDLQEARSLLEEIG